MSLPVARCGDCLYSEPYEDNKAGHGVPIYCRKNAPGETGWPAARSYDWCGKFAHRELERWRENDSHHGPKYIKQWRFPTETE